MIQDLPFILSWWLMLFGLGLLIWPLTKRIFSNFFDLGYPFAKILAILLLSYLTWLLGSLKILPFFRETILLVIVFLALINLLIFKTASKEVETKDAIAYRLFPSFLRVFRERGVKILLFEELLFFLAFLFWAWVRAHEPSIHGLEKFMDFGFINSILKSNFFPPHDMWLSPSADPRYNGTFTINYYYFGHLTAAILTKLSGIDSAITYNLVLASLFALCFTGAFSIGGNLINSREHENTRTKERGEPTKFFLFAISERLSPIFRSSRAISRAVRERKNFRGRPQRSNILAGLLTAFLVTLAGNLHPIYLFLKDSTKYWYPDATRFIPFTIHEFPIYSWVVADLHGHVFDIPFVLLAIAMLISVFSFQFSVFSLGLLGLVLAVLYMTNAWDGIIYFGLSGLVILVAHLKTSGRVDRITKAQSSKLKAQSYNLKRKTRLSFKFFAVVLTFALLALSFLLFSLPFNLNFQPFVKGIGVNCPLSFLPEKWGPFIFEKQNCQRSPIWMLAILWGFFYFNAAAFLIYLFRSSSKQTQNSKLKTERTKKRFRDLTCRFDICHLRFEILRKVDIFLFLMIVLSTFLLIFPEFFYAKDIYPAHFRANTMFKLGYQAFIMMSIASGYIIAQALSRFKQMKKQIKTDKFFVILLFCYFVILLPQLFLVSIYPYYAIVSYYGNLKIYHGLDGAAWLKQQYPDDYEAIKWLKRNTKHETCYMLHVTCYPPIVVEAVGESYTDYARVSAYTGLPTIIGWPVHEWLWRGSYDEAGARIPEVQTIYESKDLEETKKMLEKYKVTYVFIGSLEREKYKNLNEGKFNQLGKIVFQSGETKIYQLPTW